MMRYVPRLPRSSNPGANLTLVSLGEERDCGGKRGREPEPGQTPTEKYQARSRT